MYAHQSHDEQYLTVNDVAARYKVGRSTVWEQTAKGRIPAPIRLTPRTTRWRLSDLERWEEKLASEQDAA